MNNSDEHKTRSFLVKGFKLAVGAVSSVVVLIAGYHGLNSYVDYRIEKRIHDPKFLRTLSQVIRPSVVFDQNNSILADLGAMDYIDSISVISDKGDPTKIVVSPKAFLGIAPLLECIDGDFALKVARGKRFNWIYELDSVDSLLLSPSATITNHRFRLEVLR